MRPSRRPRRALFVLTLIALACTGGTFTCNGHSDDGQFTTTTTVN